MSENAVQKRDVNKRQWIVGGVGVLVIVVMYALSSFCPLVGISTLWWHRAIGALVVLTPILVFAFKDPKPPVKETEDGEDPVSVRIAPPMYPEGWFTYRGCAAIALIPVALFMLPLLFSYDIQFNSADWQTDCRGSWGFTDSRARMVDDLQENHLRVGMPRAEVEALLGCEGGCTVDHPFLGGVEILDIYYLDGRVTSFEVVEYGD